MTAAFYSAFYSAVVYSYQQIFNQERGGAWIMTLECNFEKKKENDVCDEHELEQEY